MGQKTYTISIYSENNVGLLSRVSAIFLKRHINIDSLNTSMSEIEDIFRFVIVAKLTEEQVIKIVKQIEKQIEVIKAFYHTDEDVVMTSKGELWALPGKGFPGSYIILPERYGDIVPKGAMGICTDYAIKYKDKYK